MTNWIAPALARTRRSTVILYRKHIRRQLLRASFLRPLVAYIDKRQLDDKWRERDPEENQTTSPPDGEEITLRSLWAMEFYSPSQADQLLGGFEALGWAEDDAVRENPAQWVSRDRSTMFGGGWFNLGVIQRGGEYRYWPDARTAPLPDNVEYALGAVITLTSSLTCVILQFVYSDEFSSRYDRAVRTERTTYLRPNRRGVSFISPHTQKEEEIADLRAEVRYDAWSWFRTHLPGVFSGAKALPDEFPTCEFVTTKKVRPFPDKEERKAAGQGFLSVLALRAVHGAWKVTGYPALRFLEGTPRNRAHAIVGAREGDLRNLAKEHHFIADRDGQVQLAEMLLQRLLSCWGLVALLSSLQKRVNGLRDSAVFRSKRAKESVKLLSELSDIEFHGLDVGTISAELRQLIARKWFSHDVSDLEPVDPTPSAGGSYLRNLERFVADQCRWLDSADQQVRRALTQQGNLIATRENIRLQKAMQRLTILIAFLTVFTFIATVEGSSDEKLALTKAVAWLWSNLVGASARLGNMISAL